MKVVRLNPLTLTLLLFACKGDYELNTRNNADTPPDDTAAQRPDTNADGPVAKCEVSPNPVHPPFEAAEFDGSASFDPDGFQLVEYRWGLVSKPDGSAVNMPQGQAVRSGFIPDLAGDYVAELTVINEKGKASEPCQVTLGSEPQENLWIEMFWQESGDDMDLHLLRPGGTIETVGDCYFANCVGQGLDWGTDASSDDPHLDLDDISGTGPENINIEAPAAGDYTIVVHDYPGSPYTPANDVTVNIYINGNLVWTDTRTISGEDTYTNFARVTWGGSGTVTPL